MAKEYYTMSVEGMSCSHCENRIKNAVEALNGVRGVTVDLNNQKVRVEFDDEKVSIDTIKNIIEDQGYEVK